MDRLPEREDNSLHCESAASFSLKTFFAEVKQKDGKGALSQFLVCSERAALLPALPQPPSSGISMFFRMCLYRYASCLFTPDYYYFLHHTVRPHNIAPGYSPKQILKRPDQIGRKNISLFTLEPREQRPAMELQTWLVFRHLVSFCKDLFEGVKKENTTKS